MITDAMRLFHYDPISRRSRERCTVAALRADAAATGVDTAVHFRGKRRNEQGTTGAELAGRPKGR